MMHSPCFRFPPYFQQILKLCGNFLKFYLFPKKFSSAKISDDLFFSDRPQISNSLCFSTFPPVSRKLLFPPYFQKFSPLFSKNSPAFYILFVYFVSPYFDHDAFMHHPMHVLDAPAC